jgi:hypothetical protein
LRSGSLGAPPWSVVVELHCCSPDGDQDRDRGGKSHPQRRTPKRPAQRDA